MNSISLGIDEFANHLKRPPLRERKTLSSNIRNADEEDDAHPIGGPGFNFNTVEWPETFGS